MPAPVVGRARQMRGPDGLGGGMGGLGRPQRSTQVPPTYLTRGPAVGTFGHTVNLLGPIMRILYMLWTSTVLLCSSAVIPRASTCRNACGHYAASPRPRLLERLRVTMGGGGQERAGRARDMAGEGRGGRRSGGGSQASRIDGAHSGEVVFFYRRIESLRSEGRIRGAHRVREDRFP